MILALDLALTSSDQSSISTTECLKGQGYEDFNVLGMKMCRNANLKLFLVHEMLLEYQLKEKLNDFLKRRKIITSWLFLQKNKQET